MRRGLGLWLVVGIGGLLAANGCGTMQEDSAGDGVFAELPLELMCPELAEALCDAKATCTCFDASARSLCVASELASCEATTQARMGDGQQGYNPSAAQQCIDQLGAVVAAGGDACVLDPAWPPACGDVFSGGGTEGSPCAEESGCIGDAECNPCVPGLECRQGQCHLLPGDGEACHAEYGCATGTRCVDETCRATLPAGQSCTSSSECNEADGLYCAPRASCASRGSAGEPCNLDSSPPNRPRQGNCQPTLFCNTATGACQERLAVGDDCDATDQCAEGLYCNVPVDGSSPTGTCGERLLPAAACDRDDQCPAGYFCPLDQIANARVCTEALGPDAPCSRDAQCAGLAGCRASTFQCNPKPNVEGADCSESLLCAPENGTGDALFCSADDGYTCRPGTGVDTYCHYDFDSPNNPYVCQPGLYCDFDCDDCAGGVCQPAPGPASSCAASLVCEMGYYCGSDSYCHEGSGEDEPCAGGFVCQPGLFCDYDGTCKRAPVAGEPCGDAMSCDVGAFCAARGQCTPPGGVGEGCESSCYGWLDVPPGQPYQQVSTRPPCEEGLFCQVTEYVGVCAEVATAGSPCEPSSCESSCVPDQYCRTGYLCVEFPAGGEGATCDSVAGCPSDYYCAELYGYDTRQAGCVPLLGQNEECLAEFPARQCQAGLWCNDAQYGEEYLPPRCEPQLPDGVPCDAQWYFEPCLGECIDGRCANAPVQGICAAEAKPF